MAWGVNKGEYTWNYTDSFFLSLWQIQTHWVMWLLSAFHHWPEVPLEDVSVNLCLTSQQWRQVWEVVDGHGVSQNENRGHRAIGYGSDLTPRFPDGLTSLKMWHNGLDYEQQKGAIFTQVRLVYQHCARPTAEIQQEVLELFWKHVVIRNLLFDSCIWITRTSRVIDPIRMLPHGREIWVQIRIVKVV